MNRKHEGKTDAQLIEDLRRAAGIWFKNDDLLLLEELILRYALAKRAARHESNSH